MRGAVLGTILGVCLGFGLDDPEDRVETVTETVEVEVPGPEVVRYERVPLPDSCARMVTVVNDALANIAGYSTAAERDTQTMNQGISAVAQRDVGLINRTIDDMSSIEFEAIEWYSALDANADELAELQPQCSADVED